MILLVGSETVVLCVVTDEGGSVMTSNCVPIFIDLRGAPLLQTLPVKLLVITENLNVSIPTVVLAFNSLT